VGEEDVEQFDTAVSHHLAVLLRGLEPEPGHEELLEEAGRKKDGAEDVEDHLHGSFACLGDGGHVEL